MNFKKIVITLYNTSNKFVMFLAVFCRLAAANDFGIENNFLKYLVTLAPISCSLIGETFFIIKVQKLHFQKRWVGFYLIKPGIL